MTTAAVVRNEMTEYWDAGFLAAAPRLGAVYDLKELRPHVARALRGRAGTP